ncbi:hypothetical protein BEP19_05505 [Ammoniphilus oxalaticus]|uniref:Prepilin-type N-terminal cleavage/methylation domain-containing protein n=1 Tax=Ammoniphilus oxalaticus TaxID=66863 RepID=A0A419SIP8_9BACL|nr:prepilin-type N-terminal cleavage/methylation domain-containing protein [Ammoniphilus oxalaticus]RKD23883.1 hypothetical protein BEP19_05505 [Ammoniphilus oxalaticus]
MNIKNNQKGLTLIETLAATAILSLVVLMFANLSGYTLLADQKDDQQYRALQLAEKTINEIRKEAAEEPPYSSEKLQTEFLNNFNKESGAFSIRATHTDGVAPSKHSISLATVILAKKETGGGYIPEDIFVTVSWGDQDE